MRKALIIGLTVILAVSILSGCIGDEQETPVTVKSVKSSDSQSVGGTTTSQNPPEGTPQSPPEGAPQNPPEGAPQNPPQSPPEGGPQNPPQTPPGGSSPGGGPQNPPPSMNLEEPTPEEEEEAIDVALEDERVQDLVEGSEYTLEAIGCTVLPSGDKVCFLLLELENGDKYTIMTNLSTGVVMDVREGEMGQGNQGESGNG
ncbi:MAG: hypothetical protein WBA22_01750 [Candidatus Methanofastidiosia archaeon]